MNKLLELKNVSLKYQTPLEEIEAIKSVSFNCCEGEFISIIGPSGCGKTSVLSLIAGLLKPSTGRIIIDNQSQDKPKEYIGYMLQKDHLFPWRTIENNIYLPLEIKKIKSKENKKYALSLLEKYGLGLFKKNYPDQLSGGMRQRVALIRTLALKPEILLLDEPFSALDYQTRLELCDNVYSIIENEKRTAILVTHDIYEAITMSDRIIVLTARPGKIKAIHKTNFNKNLTPFERRKSEEAKVLFDTIWQEIQNEKNNKI